MLTPERVKTAVLRLPKMKFPVLLLSRITPGNVPFEVWFMVNEPPHGTSRNNRLVPLLGVAIVPLNEPYTLAAPALVYPSRTVVPAPVFVLLTESGQVVTPHACDVLTVVTVPALIIKLLKELVLVKWAVPTPFLVNVPVDVFAPLNVIVLALLLTLTPVILVPITELKVTPLAVFTARVPP